MSILSHADARRTYDRIGARQDTQRFYEDQATALLIEHGRFESASRVFEFGCGTGRFAATLLREHLPEAATYRALDLSPKMVSIAAERLAAFGDRARVSVSDGGPPAQETSESCDRFASNYVFDLLSDETISAVLAQAHRMLVPDGLLCVCGLSPGCGFWTGKITRALRWIHARRPSWIGGCRPLELTGYLDAHCWDIVFQRKIAAWGITSEAIIARPLGASSTLSSGRHANA